MPWNLEEAIAYYGQRGAPADQSALVSLLREVQQENGGAEHEKQAGQHRKDFFRSLHS